MKICVLPVITSRREFLGKGAGITAGALSSQFIRCGCLLLFPVAFCSPAFGGAITYNRDIRPILSDNCFYCHGPDAGKRKAKLRLDVRDKAIDRKAFVPGKPQESELVRRIFSSDTKEIIPHPDSNKKLNPEQKELLRR